MNLGSAERAALFVTRPLAMVWALLDSIGFAKTAINLSLVFATALLSQSAIMHLLAGLT